MKASLLQSSEEATRQKSGSPRVCKAGLSSIKEGSVIYLRFWDHVLFRDVDPRLYKPFIRETIGWLDYEDEEWLRIVWERFAMPNPPNESKPRATGLAIFKRAVIEMRRIG